MKITKAALRTLVKEAIDGSAQGGIDPNLRIAELERQLATAKRLLQKAVDSEMICQWGCRDGMHVEGCEVGQLLDTV